MTPFVVNKAKTATEHDSKIAPIKQHSSVASVSNTTVVSRMKYESCKNFRETGYCKYGDKCLFAHGAHELTRRGSPTEEKPKVEVKNTETELKNEEDSKIV